MQLLSIIYINWGIYHNRRRHQETLIHCSAIQVSLDWSSTFPIYKIDIWGGWRIVFGIYQMIKQSNIKRKEKCLWFMYESYLGIFHTHEIFIARFHLQVGIPEDYIWPAGTQAMFFLLSSWNKSSGKEIL